MRYFSVNKEELSGMVKTGEIYSDGTYINRVGDIECRTITLGYSVSEYDEQGTLQNVMFYKVTTDMGDLTNNEDKVLNTINKGWQNNNW